MSDFQDDVPITDDFLFGVGDDECGKVTLCTPEPSHAPE